MMRQNKFDKLRSKFPKKSKTSFIIAISISFCVLLCVVCMRSLSPPMCGILCAQLFRLPLAVAHCSYELKLTSSGPVMRGANITFRGDLYYSNGNRPENEHYRWVGGHTGYFFYPIFDCMPFVSVFHSYTNVVSFVLVFSFLLDLEFRRRCLLIGWHAHSDCWHSRGWRTEF